MLLKSNDKGFYPNYSGYAKKLKYIDATLEALLYLYSHKIEVKEIRYRTLCCDITEYLEKCEGYHFGVSEKAFELSKSEAFNTGITGNVIVEHAIPFKILQAGLKSLNPKSTDDILNFFRHTYFLCIVTKEEDKALSAKPSLSSKMPIGWSHDWQSVCTNWKDRYKERGIDIKTLPGK